MIKSELRTLYKSKRNQLSIEDINSLSLEIANQALQIDIWKFDNYHIFMPITEHKEINTEYLLHILQGKDKNVIVSKSDFSKISMQHFLLTDTTRFRKNKWNIPEPIDGIKITDHQIDVVFVPLLAYDSVGHRVGYGKGFYDRFLSNCKPETVKIGLSFFEPLEDTIDSNPSDIRLDYAITPKKVFSFKS